MKILLNIDRTMLTEVGEWVECQAVRLQEESDGSFVLDMTKDLRASREKDAAVKEYLDNFARMMGREASDG